MKDIIKLSNGIEIFKDSALAALTRDLNKKKAVKLLIESDSTFSANIGIAGMRIAVRDSKILTDAINKEITNIEEQIEEVKVMVIKEFKRK